MKHLPLETPQYRYLEQSFAEWLDILGYAETTVKSLPVHVRELLNYLEQEKKITTVTQVKAKHIFDFVRYLKNRPNLTKGGGLSASHINKTIQAVTTFARYLNQTAKHNIDVHPRRLQAEVETRIILTPQEIKALYEATYEHHRENSLAMGQRDRAIIAVFYGCGLRKDEGVRLDINDIQTEKALLFVRKGKGNKERLVPIAGRNLEDMQRYMDEGRDWFLHDNRNQWHVRKGTKKESTDDEAFFLSQKGQRLCGSGFYSRLKVLKEKAGIRKDFALHSLRHSIATHLLQAGMDIEEIRRFLGHSTLESTQIYTHIVNELNQQEQELITNDLMTNDQ